MKVRFTGWNKTINKSYSRILSNNNRNIGATVIPCIEERPIRYAVRALLVALWLIDSNISLYQYFNSPPL